MVRTMDSGGRASGGKAPRKAPATSGPSSNKAVGTSSKSSGIGGNPACPRDTPAWQKPITTFFTKNDGTPIKSKDSVDLAKINSDEHQPKEIPAEEGEGTSGKNIEEEEESEKENTSLNSGKKSKRKRLIIEDDDDD